MFKNNFKYIVFIGALVYLFKDRLFKLYKDMTQEDKENIETHTKQWEGGLSRDMGDTASKLFCPTPYKDGHKYHTNKGITYTTWKSVHGSGHDNRFLYMNNKDWFDIYWNKYYKACKADKLKSWNIGVTLTQFCWGSGVYGGSKLFQKILNNTGANLVVDGKIGSKTIDEANKRNPKILFDQLIDGRKDFFESLAQSSKYSKFLNGWLNRLNDFKEKFRPRK